MSIKGKVYSFINRRKITDVAKKMEMIEKEIKKIDAVLNKKFPRIPDTIRENATTLMGYLFLNEDLPETFSPEYFDDFSKFFSKIGEITKEARSLYETRLEYATQWANLEFTLYKLKGEKRDEV